MHIEERHNDIQRWLAFKKADRRAFEEIYRNNFDDLQQYGLSICHDEEYVLDAIHTLFFDLWIHKEQLSDTDHIRYYLLKGLRRVITHQLARKRKQQSLDWHRINTQEPYETVLIEEQAQEEATQKLRNALQQLSIRQREIVYLKFYENLTYQEIADLTSLKVRTVYNTVHQAIAAMRRSLIPEVSWFFVLAVSRLICLLS